MYGSLFVYDLRKPDKPITKLVGHESSIKSLEFYRPKEAKELQNNDVKPKINNYTNNSYK